MVEAHHAAALVRWIALLPLIGALVQFAILFVARRSVRKTWVMVLTLVPVVFSFLFGCAAFAELIQLAPSERLQRDAVWNWVGLGVSNEAFSADLAFRFDALSGSVSLVVLATSLAILLFGFAFMEDDKRPDAGYPRFFATTNLLLSFMLILILGDNLLVILAGWIGTGLASAWLVGFWYASPGASRAALRSLGLSLSLDALLLASFAGLFWMLSGSGPHTASLADLQTGIAAHLDTVIPFPLGDEVRAVGLFAFGIALAGAGRSAQLPFTFALSGIARSPVPAAAMGILSASTGIYLCCRFSFLIVESPPVMVSIAWAGALTALIGAAVALAQRDLVAILIATTLSQFGFAFVAIGCGAYSAAVFQLVVAVMVQSLLILCAGSVIYRLEGERDIRRMGGLNVRLVVTQWMVLVGVLSPAVFLAREQAIATAFGAQHIPGSKGVFALALVATLVASWAITRFLASAFWGSIRTPLGFRGEFADPEPRFMIPIYGLAFLTVLAVALNPAQIWGDLLIGDAQESDSLRNFLSSAIAQIDGASIESGLRWQLVAGSALATLLGFSTTYLFYIRFPPTRAKINARISPLQRTVQGADAGGVLERMIGRPLLALSDIWVDRSRVASESVSRVCQNQAAKWVRFFERQKANGSPGEASALHVLLLLAGALILLVMGIE